MKPSLKSVSFFSLICLGIISSAMVSKLANSAQTKPIPLIFDDDGSQDGMIALAYMLQNPKFSVKAIAISQGLAHPPIFGNNMMRMLTRLKKTDIPVAIGRETPIAGNNTFPQSWRSETDKFWSPYVTLPAQATKSIDRSKAPQLIVDTIKQSPQPVTILATGSLTNIAEALRLDPSIQRNIATIAIMGGAVRVKGNLREHPDPKFHQNQVAEFNIWVDPVAAKEVLEAEVPILLVPLDATNQIRFTKAEQTAWKATGTPEGVLASELLNYGLSVIAGNDPLIPNPVWDLVAAINLSEPDFCQEVPLHLEVITNTSPETTQGQTLEVRERSPNVNVCLKPNVADFNLKNLFRNRH
jgi:pyrimidine-specific ribonucleoside hydrolase